MRLIDESGTINAEGFYNYLYGWHEYEQMVKNIAKYGNMCEFYLVLLRLTGQLLSTSPKTASRAAGKNEICKILVI